MNLIEEAKKIKNGKACPEDIDLLVYALSKLGDTPTVVMLGAGEVFTLTVFGVKPKALLYTIDNRQEPQWWEQAALDNCGVKNANHVQLLGDSVEIAQSYRGPKIDLLIVDSDHSVEGVWDDLNAWAKHLNEGVITFCHDYDPITDAPHEYPGVKKACDKFFDCAPSRAGWSAVFGIPLLTEEVKPKKTVIKKRKTTKKGK